jgi:protocatechuate 3,4-dioxygenase beta subunit
VVDQDDRPIRGAEISGAAPAMGSILWNGLSEASRVRSGDDGQFELTLPVADVLYSLHAQRLGYGSPSLQLVATKDTKPVTIRMTRGLHRKVQGRVRDGDLRVADLALTLVGEYGFSLETKTDADGAFHFDEVPEYIGQAVLVARREGHAIPQRIIRQADEDAKGLEMTLEAASQLEGQVIDGESRKAIAGAEVSIRPWFSSGFSMTVKSDSSGRFVIENVPPGSYLVEPSAPSHFDKPPRGMGHERERVELAAGESRSVVIEMARRATVRGRVHNPQGRPVSDAIVGMPCTWNGDYRNQVRYVRTDAKGNFEILTGHVEEEELRVSAFSARFGGADLAVGSLVIGEVREGLTLTLPGAVRVRGQVVDQARPIAQVLCVTAPLEVSGASSADGRFDLGRITRHEGARPPAELMLRAPRPSSVRWISSSYGSLIVPDAAAYYQDATLPLKAEPGEELDLKGVLKPTDLLVIEGRVVDAGGEPVPKAKLYLFAGNAGDKTWADRAIPQLRGEGFMSPAATDKMLADEISDGDGRFRLRTVRCDGEQTTAGTRYSIGVVLDNRGVKLIKDITLADDVKLRDVKIEVEKAGDRKE